MSCFSIDSDIVPLNSDTRSEAHLGHGFRRENQLKTVEEMRQDVHASLRGSAVKQELTFLMDEPCLIFRTYDTGRQNY